MMRRLRAHLQFVHLNLSTYLAGIRKSGSRDTKTPLEELAVKDSINAIHKAQV